MNKILVISMETGPDEVKYEREKKMNKFAKKMLAISLAAVTVAGTAAVPQTVYATEVTEQGDDVVITEKDKPYLALGADLTADQQHKVLSYMGIDVADFDQYDVVYVNNEEEHKYLDAYIPSKQIGTKSLSSVLISLTDKGSGVKVSTYNINYCTAGMYKNALATAGIEDANVIVAGPFALSGTAALVGTFEAYEEMTGESLDESVVDAAMDELVTTGELEESIDGDPEEIESMIADLKGKIASGDLDTPEKIQAAIEEAAKEHNLNLSDEDKEKIANLLDKLKGLDLNWDSIANQASEWADKLQDSISSGGLQSIGQAISDFFAKIIEAIKSLFG